MDFLAVGPSEVLMIILVAVLVVGPNRIVETARTMGRVMRYIRKASTDLTSTVTRELDLENDEAKKSAPSDKDKPH